MEQRNKNGCEATADSSMTRMRRADRVDSYWGGADCELYPRSQLANSSLDDEMGKDETNASERGRNGYGNRVAAGEYVK